MLNVARNSMKLFFLRNPQQRPGQQGNGDPPSGPPNGQPATRQAPPPTSMQIVEVSTLPNCLPTALRAVMADGNGLRPLYPESEYEWVTHETVISKDEVAMAIIGRVMEYR